MRHFRYVCLWALMLVGALAHGQDFNPDTPPEPNPAFRLSLTAQPQEAAVLSGSGMYKAGTRVSVNADASGPQWLFVNWTDQNGDEVSKKQKFTYTTTSEDVTLTANFRLSATSQLTIKSDPETLFEPTVKTYPVGESINIYCNNYSNYTFINWTDDLGTVVSTERSFYYSITENDRILTANYKFTPSTPDEPSETKPKHKVYFISNPADVAYFSQSSGMMVTEGASFSVYTYNYGYYTFVNWTDKDGNELCTSSTYEGTMGTDDIYLIANYVFTPQTPSEPNEPTQEHHSLYLPTVQMYQNETALLPVYLENTSEIKSLTFSIALPGHVVALTDDLRTTGRSSAYNPTATQDGTSLHVSLAGGSRIADHNGAILYIPLKTTEGCVDGEYQVDITDAEASLTDGSSIALTTRCGFLEISTLEEGDMQAQFSIDRYNNRVQCTNMTGENAKSFLWDFGDGSMSTEVNPMHIYSTPGTYTIRLTAKAVIKESTAEQVIVINGPDAWTAGGDYSIDPAASGIRNFTSVTEMMQILSQCSLESDINVIVASGTLDEVVEDDITRSYFDTMSDNLSDKGYILSMCSVDETAISIKVKIDYAYYATLLRWIENVTTQGITVTVNGINVNPQLVQAISSQTIADGETTQEVNLVDAIYATGVTVTWTATASTSITGFAEQGQDNIPAMTLYNSSDITGTIVYDITYTYFGIKFYTTTYTIYVTPTFANIADTDYQALKVLYSALYGDSWKNKWDIENSQIIPDNWYGVTFDEDGNVTAIDLDGNGLKGTLPDIGFEIPTLASLNLSHNDIRGNIPAFVRALPALTDLDLSYCMFEAIDELLPSHIDALRIDHQYDGRSISDFPIQLWDMGKHIADVQLSSIISYNHQAQDWSSRPRLYMRTNSYGSVAYLDYDSIADTYAITFNGNYNLENNAEVQIQAAEGDAEGCRMRATISWINADANADGAVDIADAQHTLNYILGRCVGNFNYNAANTYEDATINIQDIVATVNVILDTTPSTPAYVYGHKESALSHLYATSDAIALDSSDHIGALDISLRGISPGDVSLALDPTRFSMATRATADGVRVIVLSPCGCEIPSGVILHFNGACQSVAATGVDIDAARLNIAVAEISSIDCVETQSKSDVIYDIYGRRLPSTEASHSRIIIINGKKSMK